MKTSQLIIVAILLIITIIIATILYLVKSKKRKERVKGINEKGAKSPNPKPNNPLLEMTLSDQLKFIHPEGSFENTVISYFHSTLKSHIKGIMASSNDPILAQGLQSVLDHTADIQKVVELKTIQCLTDGKGHSASLRLGTETLISVSCWNCSLQELKTRFESQFGPYQIMLTQYIKNLVTAEDNIFVHIFYCFNEDNCGITLCYYDARNEGLCILPNELIGTDNQINNHLKDSISNDLLSKQSMNEKTFLPKIPSEYFEHNLESYKPNITNVEGDKCLKSAISYFNEGDYNNCLTQCNKALAFGLGKHEQALAYETIGEIYIENKELLKAVESFIKCLSITDRQYLITYEASVRLFVIYNALGREEAYALEQLVQKSNNKGMVFKSDYAENLSRLTKLQIMG